MCQSATQEKQQENLKHFVFLFRITAFVPKDGGMSFIDENDEVLVAGFGRSGHAVGDLPGVRFRIVKVAGVSLYALWLRKKEKPIK